MIKGVKFRLIERTETIYDFKINFSVWNLTEIDIIPPNAVQCQNETPTKF